MRITRIAAVAVGALLVAGCGVAATATAVSMIPTVQQAAADIGATNVEPYKTGPMASGYAHAEYKGHRVTIATFATQQLENDWVNMAGLAGTIVAEGSLYAAIEVTSSTPKAAVALDCAVLDTGSSGPETRIHVTNGSSYEGSAVVTFSDGTADVFPQETIPVYLPSGQSAWTQVPTADVGASAEPKACSAKAS
jgi:hypothetical protein